MFVPRLSTLKIAVLKQGIGEQMSLSSPENPQLGIATIRYYYSRGCCIYL